MPRSQVLRAEAPWATDPGSVTAARAARSNGCRHVGNDTDTIRAGDPAIMGV